VAIWKLDEATQAYGTGHALRVNHSSVVAKAFTAHRIGKTAGTTLEVAGYTTLATDAADVGNITLSGLTSREYLWLLGIGFEGTGTSAPTATSYTAMSHTQTTGSGATTNIGVRGLYRILTGTNQTVDPNTGGGAVDHASILVAIYEAAAGPFTHEETGIGIIGP
jgi:hypothetical protein